MSSVDLITENDADFYRWFMYQTMDGAPIDMTGASLLMRVRRFAADVAVVMECSTDNSSFVIIDAPNGTFTLMIKQTDLVQMQVGSYDQSLVMTLNGIKQHIWTGHLIINAGASR
jgi:hypothetical protein